MNLQEFLSNNPAQRLPASAGELIASLTEGRFREVPDLIESHQMLLNIMANAFVVLRAVVPERFLAGRLPDSQSIYSSAAVSMIAEHLGRPAEEVAAEVKSQLPRYTEKWRRFVADDENVDPGDVYAFYRNLSFLEGTLFVSLMENIQGLALRGYACAQGCSIRENVDMFDYGGGEGVCTSTCALLGARRSVLIETNADARNFAKWRDEQAGIKSVSYISEDESRRLGAEFDFGVCTEVLEHLPEPEAAVSDIARLLKPGGLLFLTASFLHPYPSHLIKNRALAGNEDTLMAKFGFKRLTPDSPPFPLAPFWLFYQKQ